MARSSSHTSLCLALIVLSGCGARAIRPEPEGGAGDVGGAGAGGVGGVGGAGAGGLDEDRDAGPAGAGGSSGSGGVSGVIGRAGDGGSDVDECATTTSGGRCPELAQGWFAVRISLDVWWPGTRVSDPGRGEVALAILARVDDVCDTDIEPTAELKVCGIELPIATSDITCDAHELSFDPAIWDSPRMPRFYTRANAVMLSPGEMLSLIPWTALLGLDLLDANETLPAAGETESVACANGTGLACFPDQDDDGLSGVSLAVRHDAATYAGPYGDGKCTAGIDYRFRGLPVAVDIGAGPGPGIRAEKVEIGVRANAGIGPTVTSDCVGASGDATSDGFEITAAGCVVQPESLHEQDPRPTSGDFTCHQAERIYVAENLPQYRVLQAGEEPGETLRSLGWANIDRDIPKTPSAGPRADLVYLGNLNAAEPSCWTVRTTFDPASD